MSGPCCAHAGQELFVAPLHRAGAEDVAGTQDVWRTQRRVRELPAPPGRVRYGLAVQPTDAVAALALLGHIFAKRKGVGDFR